MLIPGDSVWLLSTRHVPRSKAWCTSPPSFAHWRHGGWAPSSLDEFLASGVGRTCIFVHGNRIEWHEAPQLGLDLRHRLTQGWQSRPPIRFVIWSWPSDQIRGPLRDARVKAEMAISESFLFAKYLQTLPENEPTTVIGFSLGAQVILGASQLLGGGALERQVLPSDMPHVRPSILLAAAAVDASWLCPGGELGDSLNAISQLTLVSNRQDPVLKRFHIVTGRRDSVALGTVGLHPRQASVPILQRDFADVLGHSHSWERHVETSAIMQLMRQIAVCNADSAGIAVIRVKK